VGQLSLQPGLQRLRLTFNRNLRKVEILLRECERTEKKVDYYALDLSLVELQRTFSEISPESFVHVGFHGLHGTYDDAVGWLNSPENRQRPTVPWVTLVVPALPSFWVVSQSC
jgi:hypothetical protein